MNFEKTTWLPVNIKRADLQPKDPENVLEGPHVSSQELKAVAGRLVKRHQKDRTVAEAADLRNQQKQRNANAGANQETEETEPKPKKRAIPLSTISDTRYRQLHGRIVALREPLMDGRSVVGFTTAFYVMVHRSAKGDRLMAVPIGEGSKVAEWREAREMSVEEFQRGESGIINPAIDPRNPDANWDAYVDAMDDMAARLESRSPQNRARISMTADIYDLGDVAPVLEASL